MDGAVELNELEELGGGSILSECDGGGGMADELRMSSTVCLGLPLFPLALPEPLLLLPELPELWFPPWLDKLLDMPSSGGDILCFTA